jgi:LysR family hydrogen peroxide-inducible transcriptional activator
MDINLRDLKYLVAVADTRSFTKAAHLCHVTQPTLSGQLRKLEMHLGIVLFERNSKRVLPTAEGQSIISKARQILTQAQELESLAYSMKDPLGGTLRLGAFPTIANYLLPRVVPTIKESLPNITLILIEEKTSVLIEQLRSGMLDAAILALPIEEPRLCYEELFTEPFFLAVPKNHPLATQPTIRKEDLYAKKLLLLNDGHCLRGQALDFCGKHSASEHDFKATSLETLRQMVRAGTGITLIPSIARMTNDELCYIPFEGAPPTRTIALIWRNSSPRTKVIRSLSQLIRDLHPTN